jgi:hypothetical protein
VVLTVAESKGVLKSIRKIATGNPGFELLSLNFEDRDGESDGLVHLNLMVYDPDDTMMIIQQLQDISGVSNLTWEHGKRGNGTRNDEEHQGLFNGLH